MKKLLLTSCSAFLFVFAQATRILIPMDESQSNHLRAYGVVFRVLENGGQAQWLLNYKGGAFLFEYSKDNEAECAGNAVSFEVLPESGIKTMMKEIENPVNN